MDRNNSQLLTTLAPTPPGFTLIDLNKRHLLSGPVALLVPDLAAVHLVLEDYATRMQGLIMTTGPCMALDQVSPLLWHVRLETSQLAMASTLAPGWLASILIADDAKQQLRATATKLERVERQMLLTRQDYNNLTTRLLAQVQDLTAAKNELSELNRHLELRVIERTGDLAQANSHLTSTLEALKSTQKELIRTAQLAGLGSLVAGIAHELNTPIGTALTAATALAHEARSIKSLHAAGQLGRRAFDQHLQNSDDVTELLERNLTRAAKSISQFKEIVAGDVDEARHRFNLGDVVAGALSYLMPQILGKPYRLIQEVDPTIEMNSYSGAIYQVLTNFVSNALLHGFDGRDTGTMTLRAAALDDRSVQITFSDDGKGIAPDQLANIFEPFFTTRFGQGGSGLGLYIVYSQVRDRLGGQVEVSSVPGRGSCFTVTLPLSAPPQVTPAAIRPDLGFSIT